MEKFMFIVFSIHLRILKNGIIVWYDFSEAQKGKIPQPPDQDLINDNILEYKKDSSI